MVDEDKVVEEQRTEEAQQAVQPERQQAPPPVPEVPQIDYSAIENLQGEVAQLRQDAQTSKKASEKLESIGKILSGEQGKSFDKEKFFNDLANDPEKTLEDFYSQRSKSETEELKSELTKIKLEREDSQALDRLKTEDPDFDNVMAHWGNVMTEDEFKKLYSGMADNPDRNDIIYYKVKARINKQNLSKKDIETKANKEAKDNINKTAKSEIPSSGGNIETKTVEDDRRDRINKARDNFDVDKVLDEVMDGDYSLLWNSRQNR